MINTINDINLLIKGLWQYHDLQVLRDEVVPVVTDFKKRVEKAESELLINKQIIRRFDEVLTEKASKVSLSKLENSLVVYATKELLESHKYQ